MKLSGISFFSSEAFALRVRPGFRVIAVILLAFISFTASGFAEAARAFRSARLTFVEGTVQIAQPNSTTSSVAVLNMPLIEGSVISAGVDGQAEVEFEDGSLARITPNSGLSLVNLSLDSSGTYQTRIALLGGLTYLELRASAKFVYTVDAGGDILSPIENATVRVNLDEPPAIIAVLDGAAHVTGPGGSDVEVNAGQTAQADALAENGIYTIRPGIAPESWDRWNEDRDEVAATEESAQTDVRSKFSGNQGYGWSDLDANGNWYDVPGKGQIWQPDVAAAPEEGESAELDAPNQNGEFETSFDPYGYGSWAWTPAGYSWASGYGWGWLPYRCGQWAFYGGFGWGWSPNSFCGAYGFGGYGYGGAGFGFGNVPRGYKRPHRPIPGPGPIHPILPGHGGTIPVYTAHRTDKERVIAGNTVQPLRPVGSGLVVRGGGALGAGLRRDYPVDARTHAPVLGVVTTTHGAPVATSNLRRAQPLNPPGVVPPGTYAGRQSYTQPIQRGGSQPLSGGVRPASPPPASMNRPAQPAPMQRQMAPAAPRYSPPPASAPRSAPSAAPAASKGK